MKFLKIIFLLILMLIIWKCIGNPASSEYNLSYTPLNVGDVRQLIFHADSSTALFSIVGKTKRSDGTEVFIGDWIYGTQENVNRSYYLVKDGYYIATELDTTDRNDINKSINPFAEQRLAKSYPKDGDSWQHTLGDSGSLFFHSHSIEQFSTFCGIFENVFGFELSSSRSRTFGLMTFYTKGIGYIGTSLLGITGADYSCSYIKVNSKIYGKLWPEKDPDIIIFRKQKLLNALIFKYPFLIDQQFQINGEELNKTK